MNLTEARRQARLTLGYGYFRENAASFYVFCPVCRERVIHAGWVGDLDTEKKIVVAVGLQLVEHLTVEH